MMKGETFGRLTVLRETGAVCSPNGTRFRRVVCRCECGKQKTVRVNNLRSGHTHSCGCLVREIAKRGANNRNLQRRALADNMEVIIGGFLGWTTEYLNFLLAGDTHALVDERDYLSLSRLNWHLRKTPTGVYYAVTTLTENGRRRSIAMHRMILPLPKGLEVDHKNINGLDNRRENLRPATTSQNCANRRTRKAKNKTSQYKGVTPSGGNWVSRLTVSGKCHYLGSFPNEQEAALAYNEAAKKLFGEFARVNKV